MARTGRLFSLLQLLRGKRRPPTAAALAAELGVSERTLYRDIAELVAQGAPIQGEAGVGYVLRQGMFLPPLMLSREETEAVVLGLRYVDQYGDAVLTRAAAEALAKISAILSTEARDTLADPITLPGPRAAAFPDNAVDYAVLRACITQQRKLSIAYTDADGGESRRVTWPLALGFMRDARVLVAWCETRQAYRTFRTDRITAAQTLADRYPGKRRALLAAWRDQTGIDEAGHFAADR